MLDESPIHSSVTERVQHVRRWLIEAHYKMAGRIRFSPIALVSALLQSRAIN